VRRLDQDDLENLPCHSRAGPPPMGA
jgi:hypothetical protein